MDDRRAMTTRVLVVGGGPVGLTAAMDLAQRGIEVTLVERRHAGEPPSVKCNHVASRSMELFRRMGLSQTIRRAGLPADYPNDVAFCTTVTGTEIARIPIPSTAERQRGATGYADSWWPTPEPPHRINQIYLEPILFRHAASNPHISILNRSEILDYTQTDDGVLARGRDLDTDEPFTIACDYLIGCDGARSAIRKQMGSQFVGLAEISRNLSTFIDAPDLQARIARKPSWMSHSLNERRAGNAIAIDGGRLWLIHCRVKPNEGDFDTIDRDLAIRTVLGVGPDFQYKVLSQEDWVARRLVADRLRDRRVFICGDAAHIWIPVAGYGMNAGIADAAGLTWMLAAVLNGWAHPALLDAYEKERHPITEQVSRFVAALGIDLVPKRNSPPVGVEAAGPEGDAVRAKFGQDMVDMNVSQYCCAGLNFGYFYDDSPVIAYDGESAPPYSLGEYMPSTVPGCRAPHVWLADGESLYDRLGFDFNLLRFDPSVDVGPFVDAARQRGMPVRIVDVGPVKEPVYDRKLVLLRPDRHVAWRGNAIPEDPGSLCDLVRGATSLPASLDRHPAGAESVIA